MKQESYRQSVQMTVDLSFPPFEMRKKKQFASCPYTGKYAPMQQESKDCEDSPQRRKCEEWEVS